MKKVLSAAGFLLAFSTLSVGYAQDDACLPKFQHCMSSCESYFNQCVNNNNDQAYCSSQYAPCTVGCSEADQKCQAETKSSN